MNTLFFFPLSNLAKGNGLCYTSFSFTFAADRERRNGSDEISLSAF